MPGLLYQQLPMGALSLGGGLAPFGLRHSGAGVKGLGFFGRLSNPSGGVSTELSSEFEHDGKTIEHPLLVPTLTREEIGHLLGGGKPTQAIYDKARAFALQRVGSGFNPFAGPMELRYPLPAE